MDDEETEGVERETKTAPSPDYAFEGYSVEFLDKVALLPPARRG